MLLPKQLSRLTLESRHFSLQCRLRRAESDLKMRMYSNVLTTTSIERIVPHLELLLPGVLETRCFNENNFLFRQEVENTEIGHLFEHVLLENLCSLTVSSGIQHCTFSGETNWNWQQDPRGVFHIWVSVGYLQKDIYFEALRQSAQLLELLLMTQPSSTLLSGVVDFGVPFESPLFQTH